jgi:hypothetical protein
MSTYQWVYHNDQRLLDVGIMPDGSLHNPNGYPDELVREAVTAAEQRRKERRSQGAKKAAETRRVRRGKLVYTIAKRMVDGADIAPRNDCAVCGRGLHDPDSI